MVSNAIKIQNCPNCENELAITEGFTSWCEKCDWNIDSSELEKTASLFGKFYLSISRKYGETLFNSLVKANPEKLKPAMNFSKFIAFVISGLVHLLTVLFAISGISLFVIGRFNFGTIFLGIICVLIAWIVKPRFSSFPKNTVLRKDFPALYEFVDSISQSLNTKKIDGIIINGEFNASFSQVGLKNKSVLYIGLPLWVILTDEEKTALISHELSHGINGDPLRGFFIGTALNSLIEWYKIIMPDRIWEYENGLLGILMIPVNIFLLLLAQIVRFVIYILSHLIWINSQKAEYLADFLATNVCGTAAMIDLLEKLELGDRFTSILHRITLLDKTKDLFEEIRLDIFNLPVHEKERIKRITKLEKSRLDATHPPTFFRTEFLKNHFIQTPKLLLNQIKSSEIDMELSKIKNTIQIDIIDKYEDKFFY